MPILNRVGLAQHMNPVNEHTHTHTHTHLPVLSCCTTAIVGHVALRQEGARNTITSQSKFRVH